MSSNSCVPFESDRHQQKQHDLSPKRTRPSQIHHRSLQGLRRSFPILHSIFFLSAVSVANLLYLFESTLRSLFSITMRFSSQNALTASTLLLVAGSAAADTIENLVPRASMTYVACYSSKEGFGPAQQYTFQSTGWCFDKCSGSGSGAFALTGGSQCLCGNQLPPDSAKVPDSKCSTPCDGWPQAMCMFLCLREVALTDKFQVVAKAITRSIQLAWSLTSRPCLHRPPPELTRPALPRRTRLPRLSLPTRVAKQSS